MAELVADGEPGFLVDRLLLRRKALRGRTSPCRTIPPRQLPVAPLGVGMPQAVQLLHFGFPGLPVVAVLLLGVVEMRGDQRAALGELGDPAEQVVLGSPS